VVTADRAWSSEIPVFSVIRLISSSMATILAPLCDIVKRKCLTIPAQ
jgi:hypothetical protein